MCCHHLIFSMSLAILYRQLIYSSSRNGLLKALPSEFFDFWGCTLNRSFIEDSGAGIKISPQDNNYIGLTDRVVTLTGSFEEQMRAIDLILSKLTEDSLYLQSMNAPLSYPGVVFCLFNRPFIYIYIYIEVVLCCTVFFILVVRKLCSADDI